MIKNNLILRKLTALGLIAVSSLLIVGCSRKPEAVITDGEDVTEKTVQYETLSESHEKKFSFTDLTMGQINYLMSESVVKEKLGEPEKIVTAEGKDTIDTGLSEKVYIYEGLTLIFTNINNEYKLTSLTSTRETDVFSRGIRVGDTFEKVLNAYYRDVDCMNTNYYAIDQTTVIGKYVYGNYSIENLEAVKPSGKVEYAVINFNGSYSFEDADSYILEYTYFEPPYIGAAASAMDDFCQLAFDFDNNGKVTAIRWYYYPEVK